MEGRSCHFKQNPIFIREDQLDQCSLVVRFGVGMVWNHIVVQPEEIVGIIV